MFNANSREHDATKTENLTYLMRVKIVKVKDKIGITGLEPLHLLEDQILLRRLARPRRIAICIQEHQTL